MSLRTWVAYIGVAGDLRGLHLQHFRHDSTVVTQASAVGLNIELVSHVDRWKHPDFADDDHRHVAETIAFDVLDPALRSRGYPRRSPQLLADHRGTVSQRFASVGRFPEVARDSCH
jgi:hypothetical protein